MVDELRDRMVVKLKREGWKLRGDVALGEAEVEPFEAALIFRFSLDSDRSDLFFFGT